MIILVAYQELTEYGIIESIMEHAVDRIVEVVSSRGDRP